MEREKPDGFRARASTESAKSMNRSVFEAWNGRNTGLFNRWEKFKLKKEEEKF